jgi:hypothetical protein
MHSFRRLLRPSLLVFLALPLVASSATAENGFCELTILEQATRKPFPARIHLQDAAGKPVHPRGFPAHRGHFVCDGRARFELPPGGYTYEIEHGPEYSLAHGEFQVAEGGTTTVEVRLTRRFNLAKEGWWSGDLHVHRPPEQIELLMRADDLHIAPVISWWNARNVWETRPRPEQLLVQFDGNRFYHLMAGEDEREGGALLYFHLETPLPITQAAREHPSPMTFLKLAREHPGVWVDIEKPFWWDVPVWLASGLVDSIGLANNHMCRDQMYESEAWGKPRDTARLPAPRGNGFWTQEIYYHILNTGIRLPPSAGSASGVLPNAVGYNRVYVHTGPNLTWEKWWEGLRAGRSFVSNGPLLRCTADGKWPGEVFQGRAGRTLTIDLRAHLDTRDPITRIELIRNGRVERVLPYTEWRGGRRLGKIEFTESGWFLVRVIADVPHTFRFASTAPFYVEIGDQPHRISRASAQFFLDWVRERMERVKLDDPQQREEVLAWHRMAGKFWEARVAAANAD